MFLKKPGSILSITQCFKKIIATATKRIPVSAGKSKSFVDCFIAVYIERNTLCANVKNVINSEADLMSFISSGTFFRILL
jgi:hypothetical protein